MRLVYLIIGLMLMLVGVAVAVRFALQNRALRESAAQAQDHDEELKREQAIRRNLQRICDRRGAELNRIRDHIHDNDARVQELEEQISQMNVQLFQESGRRILAEKDEGVFRVRLELAERQAREAQEKLRESQASEAKLREALAAREAELEKLRGAKARRLSRRSDEQETGQITLDDIL